MVGIVGADDGEGTPVPIPNTEVKLTGVDDTRLEAARDNRKVPTQGLFGYAGQDRTLLLSSVGRARDC